MDHSNSDSTPLPLVRTEYGTLQFECDGVTIHDPLASSCGRFRWSADDDFHTPANYGFKVALLDGGKSAWEQTFLLAGSPVVMHVTDKTGATHNVPLLEAIRICVTDTAGVVVALWHQDDGTPDECPPEVIVAAREACGGSSPTAI